MTGGALLTGALAVVGLATVLLIAFGSYHAGRSDQRRADAAVIAEAGRARKLAAEQLKAARERVAEARRVEAVGDQRIRAAAELKLKALDTLKSGRSMQAEANDVMAEAEALAEATARRLADAIPPEQRSEHAAHWAS